MKLFRSCGCEGWKRVYLLGAFSTNFVRFGLPLVLNIKLGKDLRRKVDFLYVCRKMVLQNLDQLIETEVFPLCNPLEKDQQQVAAEVYDEIACI